MRFATNDIVISKIVYRLESGRIYNYMKYDFGYNRSGQVAEKEAFRWDNRKGSWMPCYRMRFVYSVSKVSVDYARWHKKEKAYSKYKKRSNYTLDTFENPVTVLNHQWNNSGWMVVEYVRFGEEN